MLTPLRRLTLVDAMGVITSIWATRAVRSRMCDGKRVPEVMFKHIFIVTANIYNDTIECAAM